MIKYYFTFCLNLLKNIWLLGDISDSKTPGGGSRQYEEEWQMYADILKAANVKEKLTWLEVPGNHG